MELMSPTVFRWREYRFFFFSREELRPHVHISGPEGHAKFWLEPDVETASIHGLSPAAVALLERTVKEKRDEIIDAWHKHFRS